MKRNRSGLLKAFVASAVACAWMSDSFAQTQPANKRVVFPRQDLPSIPLPGRPVKSPYVSQPNANPGATASNTRSLPDATLTHRATLPTTANRRADVSFARPFNMDAATAQLFGDVRGFTARAEMDLVVGPANARDTNTVPIIVAYLDGRMRTDMDLQEVRANGIPAPTFTSLLAVGINQVVNIVRPDRGLMHLMYPELKGFTDFPLTLEETSRTLKIVRTDAGRGTAVGQACLIQGLVVTDRSTNRHEATVWLSQSMGGFPVQIQWHESIAQVTLRYLEVYLITPDLALFEPTRDYAKYPDHPMLLQNALQRRNIEVRTRRGP